MRTLPAELEAVNNGTYQAVFRWKYYSTRAGAVVFNHTRIKGFKIANLEIEAQIASSQAAAVEGFIQLLRGALINGTEYLIGTSKYKVFETVQEQKTGIYTIRASLIPKIRISIAGDDTYQNVITAFCTACSLTPEFKNPGAAVWGYQFLPTGKQVILNDARLFVNLLLQKYLITASDQEGDVIQFAAHSAAELDAATRDADLEDRPFLDYPNIATQMDNEVRFLWRDEVQTTHYSGDTTKRLHNLGYLESTDSAPDIFSSSTLGYKDAQVDLRLTSNDIIGQNWNPDNLEYALKAPFKVIETFDQQHTPSWRMDVEIINPFHNTEGGALPSTIERVSNYTPINTSGFDGNLDATTNNLQALAQAVDDLPTPAAPVQAPTATNDFLIGAQVATVWTWVKNTLAQTITVLRTSLDSIYAPIAKGVTNGDTHNHVGGDGAALNYQVPLLANVAGGAISAVPASTTYYTWLPSTTLFTGFSGTIIPFAGTMKNMYIRLSGAQPASGSLVITLQKNGIDTALVVTFPAGSGASTTGSDTTHTVAWAAGDIFTWKIVNNATAPSGAVSTFACGFEAQTT